MIGRRVAILAVRTDDDYCRPAITMMPVAKIKKPSSFSIESLVGRRSPSPDSSDGDRSPRVASEPTGPATEPGDGIGFRRVLPGSAAIAAAAAKGVYPTDFYMPFHVDALRGSTQTQLAAHHPHNALPHGLPPFHGQPGLTSQIHPMLMGHGREVVPFYPWLIPRHGGYYNHRYTG